MSSPIKNLTPYAVSKKNSQQVCGGLSFIKTKAIEAGARYALFWHNWWQDAHDRHYGRG